MTADSAPCSRIPPPIEIPEPPTDPAELDPLVATWPAGHSFCRIFDVNWGSRQFFAGDDAHRGRFHPLARSPIAGSGSSRRIKVLYGASDLAGAMSETVFHDVPKRGAKRVPRAKLVHRLAVELVVVRDLQLIDLTSDGLRRLGLRRSELIESDARSYPATASWARALHGHPVRSDGLVWTSRQQDTSRALVLFGDRVAARDVGVQSGAVPLPLAVGAGLELVCQAASRAGITITGLGG